MSRVDLYPSIYSPPADAQIQTGTVSGNKVGADVQVIGGTVYTQSSPLSLQLDDVGGTVLYIGEAPASTSTSTALWRIKKITFTGDDISIQWAGAGAYGLIWDNRLSYTYT
jgi:hypothetical protein